MADYKAIKGHNIETVAGDPSILQVGDIWYSNTTRKIRGAKLVAAWSSAAATTSGRAGGAGGGTQTAAWISGGNDDPQYYLTTELYDGTSWTEVNDPAENHPQAAGGGVQTAAWMVGGGGVSGEHFDGTDWSHAEDCNTGNAQRGSCGPQTAALMIGSEPVTVATESYDGTNWTEVGDYPVALRGIEAVGTNTDALVFGGFSTTYRSESFTWNGSSFTATPDMNTNASEMGKSGASSGAGMRIGGVTTSHAKTANVEIYDGSSWTEVANIPAATNQGEGAGTTSATIFNFGKIADNSYPTECSEWNEAATASSFTSS